MAPPMRAGSLRWNREAIRTEPVKYSAGPGLGGAESWRRMSNVVLPCVFGAPPQIAEQDAVGVADESRGDVAGLGLDHGGAPRLAGLVDQEGLVRLRRELVGPDPALGEDLLGDADRRHRPRPTRVEGEV